MNYLITGGTGFIGGNIARTLLQGAHTIYVTGFEKDSVPEGSVYVGENFVDIEWDKLPKLDTLFHQAANNDTTETDKEKMFEANVINSKKLFTKAYEAGCRKIIYASSTAVYGNLPPPQSESSKMEPQNVYAESKVALDQYAMDFAKTHKDVIIVGLRYSNVYGKGESMKGKRSSMVWQIREQILKGNPKIFKNGEQKRDYIYIKDVVRANQMALRATGSGIYNCGSGQSTSFNDLVKILCENFGIKREIEYIENPYVKFYQNHTECDMNLIKDKLGFVPQFDIKTGIKDYFFRTL